MSEWAIDLRDVGVFRSGRWILKGVDWQVPAGACAAILGPNGSGKSTLARVVSGHLWPSHGECRVLGETFGETDLAELRKDIRLLQPAGPYDADPELNAREVVVTGFFGTLGLYKEPTAEMWGEADRALAQVGLAHVADHMYSTLSSGERVRTLIARALVQKPRLLLLDEPTAGLDLLAREQILATVQRLVESGGGPTLLMITHHVEELPPATSQVIVLSEGAVAAQGAPKQVLREEVLSKVYGCPVEVNEVGGRYYLQVHPAAWDGMIK
jgi:iron complex transport system ATP-binding protein